MSHDQSTTDATVSEMVENFSENVESAPDAIVAEDTPNTPGDGSLYSATPPTSDKLQSSTTPIPSLSKEEIKQLLLSGKSISQISQEQGIPEDTLKDILKEPEKAVLVHEISDESERQRIYLKLVKHCESLGDRVGNMSDEDLENVPRSVAFKNYTTGLTKILDHLANRSPLIAVENNTEGQGLMELLSDDS